MVEQCSVSLHRPGRLDLIKSGETIGKQHHRRRHTRANITNAAMPYSTGEATTANTSKQPVERLHTAEVTGSIPVSPTLYRSRNHWAAAFRRAASRSARRDFGLDELRQVESVPGQHLGILLDAAQVGSVVAVMADAQHLAGTAASWGKPYTPDPPRPTDQFHASGVRASPALALCQPGPTGPGRLLPPRRLRGSVRSAVAERHGPPVGPKLPMGARRLAGREVRTRRGLRAGFGSPKQHCLFVVPARLPLGRPDRVDCQRRTASMPGRSISR
jgi:hypothetical protein